MVPRKVEELPKSVALAKQIITTLVDYSNLSEEEMQPETLATSAANIAALFVSVGDLYEYPAEISKVFMQCFSTLSMQIPVLAMLVALMHRQESLPPDAQTDQPEDAPPRKFCEQLVTEHLRSQLISSLAAGEILVARLLLRVLACLVCCGCLDLTCFIALLSALLQTASQPGELRELPGSAVEALFLLACSVQWVMGPLTLAAETDSRCEDLLRALETLFARHHATNMPTTCHP